MMDSYNLAWKLAYYVNGLTPAVNSNSLLSTYRTERHEIAQQLIDFDRNFSTIFSGQVGSDGGLTPEQLMETFKTGNGFTSGVGIEYPENIIVEHNKGNSQSAVRGEDYLSGILRPGRRLLNVRMKRFADGWQRDLHDGAYNGSILFMLLLIGAQISNQQVASVFCASLHQIFWIPMVSR